MKRFFASLILGHFSLETQAYIGSIMQTVRFERPPVENYLGDDPFDGMFDGLDDEGIQEMLDAGLKMEAQDIDFENLRFDSSDVPDELDNNKIQKNKNLVKLIAKKFDKNGDGSINLEELIEWIKVVRNLSLHKEAKDKFRDYDLNENGLVSYEEVEKMLYKKWEQHNDSGHRIMIYDDDKPLYEFQERRKFDYSNLSYQAWLEDNPDGEEVDPDMIGEEEEDVDENDEGDDEEIDENTDLEAPDDVEDEEGETASNPRFDQENTDPDRLPFDEDLTLEEFKLFLHPEYHSERFCDHFVSEGLENLDKNEDDYIDKNEFLDQYYDDIKINAEIKKIKLQEFKKWDENKDGKLDDLELEIYLCGEKGYDAIVDEAEYLIQSSDIDKNGKLEFSEIVKNFINFLSSTATSNEEVFAYHDEL